MRRGAPPPPLITPPRIIPPRAARESIAIIVITHNGERWLEPCLRSVLAQTLKPDELLLVDDASTDGSAAIARSMGVSVVDSGSPSPAGMCAARMAGMAATSSALILFVDGDDVLPPTYLADLYEAIGHHDIAYPGKFRFIGDMERAVQRSGRSDGIRELALPSRAKLWRLNHVSTCSLWRRAAIEQAGGWKESPTLTMGDWHLALRVTALGGGYARSRAMLDYRLHEGNWTAQERPGTATERLGAVRRDAATVSIGCVYSGRVPDLWADWLDAVADTLRHAGKRAELIVLDDSATGLDTAQLARPCFHAITHQRVNRGVTTTTRRADATGTCNFLAAQCNELMRRSRGDVLWIIEDDILVPMSACADLLQQLLVVDDAPRAAVCGAYRNRHAEGLWVASTIEAGARCVRWRELPLEPSPVQLTGTGCLMILRDLVPRDLQFRAELPVDDRVRKLSHDWSFSGALWARGMPVFLVPSVVCRHHTTAFEWV